MKKILKLLSETLGWLLSWLVPSGMPVLWRALCAHAYTGYLKRRFAVFGEDSVIAYRALYLKGLHRISIGHHTQMAAGLQLSTWPGAADQTVGPKIVIGNHCIIREGCHITASQHISIGDNLLTGTNVLITDNSHGSGRREELDTHPSLRPICSKGPVHIGNNVWLGNNVCVLPGVTIGDGAVVGAGSVVTHNIPAYAVAAGIPARVI